MNLFSSKNTLLPSLKIPKTVKLLMSFSSFISTKFSLFLASRIFITPPSFTIPKRELPMLESSQKKELLIPSIDKKIQILSYGFSNKKVLLAHGWAGRSTQLFVIANKLLEKGYMVISFDGPAHGKSTGKTTNLVEYIATIREINKEFGPFEAGVGHSFGCMALMNVQSENRVFKKLVTVGSGDNVSDILINFSKNIGLNNKFGYKLINYFEKKWNLNIDDLATHNAAKDVKIPVLVVHDAIDGDVNVSCAVNIRQNLKNGKLFITNGLGHTKILRDKKVINTIVDFIKH
jgi:pimeloyl-ACP methyl ester carboxylesterase